MRRLSLSFVYQRKAGLTSNEDLDASLGWQLSRARTGALRSQAIVDGAGRCRRHHSRLTAIWTFHRHGSLLRDQDRALFGGQLGASTPNCLAYEAGAEALPLWEEIWPGPAMKLVGPLAARSPGLRLALALEIERHCSADEILEGRLIHLVAFVDVDGAPDIPVEAGVE